MRYCIILELKLTNKTKVIVVSIKRRIHKEDNMLNSLRMFVTLNILRLCCNNMETKIELNKRIEEDTKVYYAKRQRLVNKNEVSEQSLKCIKRYLGLNLLVGVKLGYCIFAKILRNEM